MQSSHSMDSGMAEWLDAFYSTYPGMYVVQSVLHSVVAAAVADMALLAWKISNPATRQRFRIMAIAAPAVTFPLFEWLGPARASAYFRLGSVFDSLNWMHLDIFGQITLTQVFSIIIGLTALVFVLQELLPIMVHMWQTARHKRQGDATPDAEEPEETLINKALDAIEGLPLDPGALSIVADEYMYIFSSTGLRPRVVVSTALIEEFSPAQLRAAMAHEVAHIVRSRRPVLIMVYILRVIMFYNPLAMVEFRRIAQDEEKICDDMAVAMTGEAQALAEALEMLRPEPVEPPPATPTGAGEPETRDVGKMAANLEQFSHDMLLRGRITRLRELDNNQPQPRSLEYAMQFSLASIATLGLSYFVV